MLKTTWVKFVLQLFKSLRPDFDWSNNIILFLNVINGALLLHSEDSTILKYCLASLLMAATKFNSIFKKDGYLMIVPTMIQVYALHPRNKLITEALKFIWAHFFLLDGNVFYLQVTAATATLVNTEAAFLSRSTTSSFTGQSNGLSNMEEGEARKFIIRAVYELTNSLNIEPYAFPLADELGVRVSSYSTTLSSPLLYFPPAPFPLLHFPLPHFPYISSYSLRCNVDVISLGGGGLKFLGYTINNMSERIF